MASRVRRPALALMGCMGCMGVAALAGGLALAVWWTPHSIPLLWHLPYTSVELGGGADPAARAALEEVRTCCRTRYRVLSGYRDPEKNAAAGGKSKSVHLRGEAFDLAVPHERRAELYDCAEAAGFQGYGWGNRSVHIDTGKRRWWTYDDEGNTVSGEANLDHLHKAPDNFRADWGLD